MRPAAARWTLRGAQGCCCCFPCEPHAPPPRLLAAPGPARPMALALRHSAPTHRASDLAAIRCLATGCHECVRRARRASAPQVFSMTPEDAAHGSRTAGSPRSLRMTSSSRTAAAQALWIATRPWWQPLHASSLRHARYSHRLSRCTRHCHRHRTRHPVPNDVSSGGREQTASSRRNDGEAIAGRWPAMQRLQADAGSSCRYAKSVGIAPEWKSRPSVACHRPGPRRRAAGGAGASLLGVEATECRCPASLVPRVLRLEGVRTDR